MNKVNIDTKKSTEKTNQNYFTGSVRMKEISKIIKSQEQKVFHVTFLKGARTKLHYHNGGQILIVTKGKGSLEVFKKLGKGRSKFKIKFFKKMPLNSGDIVYISPKKLHTHGSVSKRQTFSHIAINANPSKNIPAKTIWLESDFKTKVMKII